MAYSAVSYDLHNEREKYGALDANLSARGFSKVDGVDTLWTIAEPPKEAERLFKEAADAADADRYTVVTLVLASPVTFVSRKPLVTGPG